MVRKLFPMGFLCYVRLIICCSRMQIIVAISQNRCKIYKSCLQAFLTFASKSCHPLHHLQKRGNTIILARPYCIVYQASAKHGLLILSPFVYFFIFFFFIIFFFLHFCYPLPRFMRRYLISEKCRHFWTAPQDFKNCTEYWTIPQQQQGMQCIMPCMLVQVFATFAYVQHSEPPGLQQCSMQHYDNDQLAGRRGGLATPIY